MKLPVQYRSVEIEVIRKAATDTEPEQEPLYQIAISSETAVPRSFGFEILSHAPGAADLSRLEGMAVLVDHDTKDQVGVVESGRMDADRVLRGLIRFGPSARAREIKADVDAKIRRFISVGYRVSEMELTARGAEGDTYTATRWQPRETSIVPVAADITVGFGRGADSTENEVEIVAQSGEQNTRGYSNMETNVTTPQSGATADVSVRNESAEIVRMAVAYNCMDKASDWISRGLTADQVGREILNSRAAQPIPSAAPEMVKLSEREQRQYSLCKAINDVLEYREVRGFEREVSDEVSRHLPMNYAPKSTNGNGFYMPMSVRAGLDSKTSTSGAELKFTQEGPFIEMLRNTSVVAKLGATTMTGLTGPVSFPKQSTAGTAYWMSENGGADVTASTLGLTTVGLSAKTLMGRTAYSKQLFVASSNNVEQLVRRDLVAVGGLAIDLAALHGTGSNNQPSGLYITTGVNSITMGGTPTYAKLVDMVTEVLKDNALAGSLGWATTPGMAGKLAQTLVASAAGSNMIWNGALTNGTLAGYSALATNQVSSTLGTGADHGILFGDWSQLLIGQFGALEITVNPYLLMGQAMVELYMFQMCDIAVKHPESFCKAVTATI